MKPVCGIWKERSGGYAESCPVEIRKEALSQANHSDAMIEKYLGPPNSSRPRPRKWMRLGWQLPWHGPRIGGEIMPVEVLILEGKGNLQITGQIGDIMQESGQAAYSYLNQKQNNLDINPRLFRTQRYPYSYS